LEIAGFMLLIIIVLFLVWAVLHGRACPCDKPTVNECVRDEVWGVQPNHFIFFMILGFLFPKKFWEFMILGLLWEILELYISKHPEFIKKFGGCLTRRGVVSDVPGRVYAGERKYHNPIDEALGIEHPQWHTWHGSIAELIPNALGFITGSLIIKWIENDT
jgi:hypothetical protein